MNRLRTFVAVATAGAVSLFGLAGTAQADTADDVAIILENLPGAADELVAGLQEALDVLTATQSAEETSHAVGEAVVAAGTVLVAGTGQFGMLGFGLSLFEGSVQTNLAPYLQAIDDPSTAADLVNPDDLTTLIANLAPTVDAVQETAGPVLVEALKGNLVEGGLLPGLGTPAVVGYAANGALFISQELTQDTSLSNVPFLLLVPMLVAGGAAADYLQQAEDALAPVFEAATPVTEPLIGALSGL